MNSRSGGSRTPLGHGNTGGGDEGAAEGGALDWGASACIVVANARAPARETDYAIVVSESTLPAALPAVEATDDSERFRLVRFADGLTLTLRRVAAATVLIMK